MEATLLALDFPLSQSSQPKQMHNFNNTFYVLVQKPTVMYVCMYVL